MIPLVDTHCHLIAGVDDGPESVDDAVAMCRMAWDEGTRVMAATAHLNEQWPRSTPQAIREGTTRLRAELTASGLAMTVYPCAEVMLQPDIDVLWQRAELMGMADRRRYLLVEWPCGIFFDIRGLVRCLAALDLRLVLAHPERHPEMLHEPGTIEELIELGCVVQVSAESLASTVSRRDTRALRSWFERGIVHLLGSDGHSTIRRPPLMADAYRQIAAWVGETAADRICGVNGLAVLEGTALHLPKPRPPAKSWFSFSRSRPGGSQDNAARRAP